MRGKFTILILTLIIVCVGAITFFVYTEKNLNAFETQVKLSAEQLKVYVDLVEKYLKSMKLLPFSEDSVNVSNLEGYALVRSDGTVTYTFGVSKSLIEKYTNIYQYATMNGEYVFPFFIPTKRGLSILLAVKTISPSYVAFCLVKPTKCKLENSYLVDESALGVRLDGRLEHRDFLAVLSEKRKGFFLRGKFFYFVEPTGFGNYSLIVERSVWSILSTFNNVFFYLWLTVLISILLVFFFFENSVRKKSAPIVKFGEFLRNLSEFKRFESDYADDETVFKYNKLVDEYEKFKNRCEDAFRQLSETNHEIESVNDLFVEFSILFNEVRNERKDLEEALRAIFRRMLDFSKPITGIGMKYEKTEVYLGTVNSFNFDRNTSNHLSLEMKTEYKKVKYVVDVDRFTVNERTREMVKTLLHHLTLFLSIHEILEVSKSSMKYDPLTNLLTRQEFESMVKREVALADREKFPLSFMILDVKEMRKFNERYGLLNGDALLKYIANVFLKNTRFTDIVSRYGEDSFLVCFHGMKKGDCLVKEKRIVSQITQFRYEVNVKTAVLSYPLDGEDVPLVIRRLEKAITSLK